MIVIKLAALLEQRGISHREAARQSGIRHPTISEMCANKSKSFPKENLDALCKTFDCKLSDIIEYVHDEKE